MTFQSTLVVTKIRLKRSIMVMKIKINAIHNGTGDKSIINKLHKIFCK